MEADMELQMPDGRVYTGKVRNGKPHGRGIMRWKDGTRYDLSLSLWPLRFAAP
jgi:hypothetical protein